MSSNFFGATSLIGGGTGALDAIDGTDLANLDAAFVVTLAYIYFYSLDVDSAAGESSPDVISPDANAGNKRWILTGTRPNGQILFPATQNASADANTLDDYEEGTITLGVAFGGGVTGITYSYSNGFYLKIGNVVHAQGTFLLTNKGTDTGNATITGLPFTVENSTAGRASVTLYLNRVSFAHQFQGYTAQNTTTISLFEVTEAGVITNLTDGNFANDSQILASCTYRVEE